MRARAAGERVSGLRATERWEGKMLADIGDQAARRLPPGARPRSLPRGRHPLGRDRRLRAPARQEPRLDRRPARRDEGVLAGTPRLGRARRADDRRGVRARCRRASRDATSYLRGVCLPGKESAHDRGRGNARCQGDSESPDPAARRGESQPYAGVGGELLQDTRCGARALPAAPATRPRCSSSARPTSTSIRSG